MPYYLSCDDECVRVLDIVILLLVIGEVLDSHRVIAISVHHFHEIVPENWHVLLLFLHLLVILPFFQPESHTRYPSATIGSPFISLISSSVSSISLGIFAAKPRWIQERQEIYVSDYMANCNNNRL